MRCRAEQARGSRLTAADVEALDRDRSVESRAAVAAKLGQQLDELSNSPQSELAHAVLQLLVRDVAKTVRRSLAEAVATSHALPVPLAIQLTRDELDVAGPVLERSPVLTDEILVEVVRTNVVQYALAVAARERPSEAVSEALVDTGDKEVVVRLLGNGTAAISQRALQRVVDDHRSDPDVERRLVRRPELPYEIVEQLVSAVGERIEWELVRTRRIAPEQARAITSAVRDRAAIAITAREHGDRQTVQHLKDRFDQGLLTHDDLLRHLKEGDVAALEIGLGLHASLEPGQVRRLLYHQDRRHMAALCITAGLSSVHYIAIRMALDLAEAAATPGVKPLSYTAETVRHLQVQYDRLRADEAKLRELVGR
jgi:uncharacterized protein (DUF2336 family)